MELKNSMHNANKSIVQVCFLCPDVFGDVTADSLWHACNKSCYSRTCSL